MIFDNPSLSRRALGRTLMAGAASSLMARRAWSAPEPRTLTLAAPANRQIPADYAGFSYETVQLADPTFFAADNRQLVELFRNLSPQGILRLGGNSSEFCGWRTRPDQPSPPDPSSAGNGSSWMPHTFTAIEPAAVDRLAGFLEATGWNAIYGLNLGTVTPERAAEESAYVARLLGRRLVYFQIDLECPYCRIVAVVANLPGHIALREIETAAHVLNWNNNCGKIHQTRNPGGPGNVVMIEIESAEITEIFPAFGQIRESRPPGLPAKLASTSLLDQSPESTSRINCYCRWR